MWEKLLLKQGPAIVKAKSKWPQELQHHSGNPCLAAGPPGESGTNIVWQAQVQQSKRGRSCYWYLGWYQEQQAKISSLPFTPPSSDKGAQIPSHHGGGKTQQEKKQFQEERHGKPLAKNDKRIIAIFTVNSKTLFFFLLRRLTSRKEKTSHGLVKGSMLLYKMQVLAWGYSGPWASQLNCRECHAEDDSSSSLEKPKQKIPLFSHALSYIWHTCFLLWLIPFSVVEISGYEDSVGTERQLTAYGTCWQSINMGNGKTGKNK